MLFIYFCYFYDTVQKTFLSATIWYDSGVFSPNNHRDMPFKKGSLLWHPKIWPDEKQLTRIFYSVDFICILNRKHVNVLNSLKGFDKTFFNRLLTVYFAVSTKYRWRMFSHKRSPLFLYSFIYAFRQKWWFEEQFILSTIKWLLEHIYSRNLRWNVPIYEYWRRHAVITSFCLGPGFEIKHHDKIAQSSFSINILPYIDMLGSVL